MNHAPLTHTLAKTKQPGHETKCLHRMFMLLLCNIICSYYDIQIVPMTSVTSFAFTSHYRTTTTTNRSLLFHNKRVIISSLFMKDGEDNDDDLDTNITEKKETNEEFIDITLTQHKPLGCTIEETLAVEDQNAVFVSRIIKGSNADKAGLKVGDVIQKVSGVFESNKLEDVSCIVGISRIKSLISGRPFDETLQIQILRDGSKIKSNHEQSVLDLCILPDEEEEKNSNEYLNNCLNVIHKKEYSMMDAEFNKSDGDEKINCEDTDMECMLDTIWKDELVDDDASGNKEEEEEKEDEVKKPDRPWASRSSPSGTYVLDPATRKLKNIG